jgi:acylphosphatase
LKAVHILISGRVQGVGFRWFVEQRAEEHAVVGFVKNLPDGQVEVLAQAKAEALEIFCEQLRQGPAFARVDHLMVEDVAVDSSLRSFRVRF